MKNDHNKRQSSSAPQWRLRPYYSCAFQFRSLGGPCLKSVFAFFSATTEHDHYKRKTHQSDKHAGVTSRNLYCLRVLYFARRT